MSYDHTLIAHIIAHKKLCAQCREGRENIIVYFVFIRRRLGTKLLLPPDICCNRQVCHRRVNV
jgi:hypothetical protein